MESSQTMQHFGQHNLGPNGFNTLVANGFNGGAPMANGLPGGFQPFAVGTGQPWQQQQTNGRCGGFGGAVPKFGGDGGFPPHQQQQQVSGPFGCGVQRKRSLDDEDDDCVLDSNWCMTKRQRPSLGDVEAQVTIYNIADTAAASAPPGAGFNCAPGAYSQNFQTGHQMTPNMQCDDASTVMNTSAVEHATSVTASHGYDALYTYNLMLSEVYGC